MSILDGVFPPAFIPLVGFAVQVGKAVAVCESPKSVALPKVAMLTVSIVLTREGVNPSTLKHLMLLLIPAK